MRKFKKKHIFLLTAVLVLAVGGFYLRRDLNLSNMANIPIPDVVVENIEFERTVNGKDWKVVSPRVEHKDGVVYGDSMDVTITEDGGTTYIYAESGTFTRENGDITLLSADGLMRENGKEYDLKSGKVFYEAASEKWNFDGGVTLTDGRIVVAGPSGWYDEKSGECRLTGRGSVTWSDR